MNTTSWDRTRSSGTPDRIPPGGGFGAHDTRPDAPHAPKPPAFPDERCDVDAMSDEEILARYDAIRHTTHNMGSDDRSRVAPLVEAGRALAEQRDERERVTAAHTSALVAARETGRARGRTLAVEVAERAHGDAIASLAAARAELDAAGARLGKARDRGAELARAVLAATEKLATDDGATARKAHASAVTDANTGAAIVEAIERSLPGREAATRSAEVAEATAAGALDGAKYGAAIRAVFPLEQRRRAALAEAQRLQAEAEALAGQIEAACPDPGTPRVDPRYSADWLATEARHEAVSRWTQAVATHVGAPVEAEAAE